MSDKAVDRFRARAADIGIDIEVSEFPEGTRTADDAAAAIGCDVAQIVKSLVFVADDDPVLILTSGANRVDESVMAEHLGVGSLRKATADEVRDATGYAIGGTPPFGHVTPIRVLCDGDLVTHEVVWAAAGSPTAVFPLTPRLLVTATGAAVVDLTRGTLVPLGVAAGSADLPADDAPDRTAPGGPVDAANADAIAALRDAEPDPDVG